MTNKETRTQAIYPTTTSYLELCKKHKTVSPLLSSWDFDPYFKMTLTDFASKLASDMLFDEQMRRNNLAKERTKANEQN